MAYKIIEVAFFAESPWLIGDLATSNSLGSSSNPRSPSWEWPTVKSTVDLVWQIRHAKFRDSNDKSQAIQIIHHGNEQRSQISLLLRYTRGHASHRVEISRQELLQLQVGKAGDDDKETDIDMEILVKSREKGFEIIVLTGKARIQLWVWWGRQPYNPTLPARRNQEESDGTSSTACNCSRKIWWSSLV